MKKEQKEVMIGSIKSNIDILQRLVLQLDISETIDKQEYNWEDLFNALTIFNHVMGNISASHHLKKWLNIEQVSIIAEEILKNLKQTVELATWIDTHILAKRLCNKK